MGQKLRGLVGQSMAAKKRFSTAMLAYKDSQAGDTQYVATAACIAFVFAWGAGAQGTNPSGGGAAAAGFKKIKLSPGWTLSWSPGAAPGPGLTGTNGGDTTVTAPGINLIAGGGKGPPAGAVGGLCSGPWDIARRGGNGGIGNTDGTGSPDPGGGIGGGHSSGGGGGGAAGFTDILDTVSNFGGNGGGGNSTGATPGGGGGGNNLGGNAGGGGAARVLVFVFKVNPGIGGGAL